MAKNLISLLPSYTTTTTFLVGDNLPCHAADITRKPINYILENLKREIWVEGLFATKNDLFLIKRYKNPDGSYKNDFNEQLFLQWVKTIEENIAICNMENINVGKGVFVPPGKKLPKGTFIPASGIIKLDPTTEEFATKNHCTALQNLNSPDRKIYGFIDPGKMGGIFDLINHAPLEEELVNFKFKKLSTKEHVATSNLKSTIKFYHGYAITGVDAFQDIEGGKYGKQLLWSYAQPDEYLSDSESKLLLLFDNREEHNGEIIDANNYSLREIDIFLDTGEITLRKVASLTRWELLKCTPESGFVFSIEDPYSSAQSEAMQSSIPYAFLQTYLKKNPEADRIIIKIPR